MQLGREQGLKSSQLEVEWAGSPGAAAEPDGAGLGLSPN